MFFWYFNNIAPQCWYVCICNYLNNDRCCLAMYSPHKIVCEPELIAVKILRQW